MHIKGLIAIMVVLFFAHKLKTMWCGCSKGKKEGLENITRECSQASINNSYEDYIFGAPSHFVR